MKIIDINRNTLYNLYEQYPNSFNGISLEEDYLIYQGEAVNISKFNINNLLNEKTSFAAALNTLSPEEIFRIIELHVVFLTKVGLPINNIKKNKDGENKKRLLTFEEFCNIVNSSEEVNIEQGKELNTYYKYLRYLVLYEEYILPELQNILKAYREYLFDLEYVFGSNNSFNNKQEEILRKNKEFELEKAQKQGLIESNKKLELKKRNNELDEAGIASSIQVIVIIVILVIILTFVTFKLIK